MNKKEYLTMLGWDALVWTILLTSELNGILDAEESTLNAFPIVDPGGIEAFGEGAYVAKIEWVAKNTVAAPPVVDEIPPPPSVQKEDIEDAEVIDDQETGDKIPDVMSPFLKARIANLIKVGWTDDTIDNLTSPDEIVYPYVNIEEMGNVDYGNLIKAKPPVKKEVVKKVEKPEIMEPNPLLEERIVALEAIEFVHDNDSSSVTKGELTMPNKRIVDMHEEVFQSVIDKYGPSKEPADKIKEVVTKEIEKIVDASGVPADKVIVGSVKKVYPFKEGDDYWTIVDNKVIKSCWDDASEQIHDGNPDKQYYENETIAKRFIKNEPVKEPKEVVEQQAADKKELDDSDAEQIKVPIATEDILKHFDIADQAIGLLEAFKKTFFAIAQIKDTLEADLTPAKKIAIIKRAVKNIETDE